MGIFFFLKEDIVRYIWKGWQHLNRCIKLDWIEDDFLVHPGIDGTTK